MAQEGLERSQAPAPHDELAGEVVAAVMEAEVVDLGPDHGGLEGMPGPLMPDRPDPVARKRREHIVHELAHRDLSPVARLGDLELEDAAGEVDPGPGQPEH